MPRIQATESKGIEMKDGTYELVCTRTEADQIENPQFGNGDIIRFKFETVDVVDQEGDPIKLDAICNAVLSPKSKLWEYLAAFGIPVAIGHEVDTDECEGLHVLATIKTDLKPDGTKGWPKVKGLMAMPTSRQNGQTAAQSMSYHQDAIAKATAILSAMNQEARAICLSYISMTWAETQRGNGCDYRKIAPENAGAMLAYLEQNEPLPFAN